MTLNDVLNILEAEVAPVALSDEFCKKYGMYDNSGIIINCDNPVSGVLFSLDLSENSVSEAKKQGYNLIVTHHPAIYGGISRIDLVNNSQSRALSECIKCGISVISMHLNFDGAPKGIDYNLMRGLGGKNAELLATLSNGGYGRAYSIEPVSFEDYIKRVCEEFHTQRLIAYGNQRTVSRVASFCGAGCDDRAINFAITQRADVFVSSDMKHHEIAALTAAGINVLVLTHYASENYGFEKIYNTVNKKINAPSVYYCDGGLL